MTQRLYVYLRVPHRIMLTELVLVEHLLHVRKNIFKFVTSFMRQETSIWISKKRRHPFIRIKMTYIQLNPQTGSRRP
jgi:hypothetical protein